MDILFYHSEKFRSQTSALTFGLYAKLDDVIVCTHIPVHHISQRNPCQYAVFIKSQGKGISVADDVDDVSLKLTVIALVVVPRFRCEYIPEK